MNIFKKLIFILSFLILFTNFLNAEEKVSYIDIDYVLTHTIAGKEVIGHICNPTLTD